jgi:hypothetical protein
VNNANFNNYGAKITLNDSVVFKNINFDFKNHNSGSIRLEDSSMLQITNGNLINISGVLNFQSESKLIVGIDLVNYDSISIETESKVCVQGNLVNSGEIYNESVIEIGADD